MDLKTKGVTALTDAYDNFPLWSPRGDLIMFARLVDDAYEIHTIKPDGTGLKRLTFSTATNLTWLGPRMESRSHSPVPEWVSKMKGFTRMRRSPTANCS